MIRRRSNLFQTFFIIVIVVMFVWATFPFYWGIVTSLKDRQDINLWFKISLPWLTFKPTAENWIGELKLPEMRNALFNSLTAAFFSTAIAVFLGSLAGYALARFRFEKIKNKDITIWFFSQRVLPPVVIAIPFFIMMKNLHLFDTRTALVLSYTTFIHGEKQLRHGLGTGLKVVIDRIAGGTRAANRQIVEPAHIDSGKCTQGLFRPSEGAQAEFHIKTHGHVVVMNC